MKTLLTLASASFIFATTVMPNAVENCANPDWQFNSVSQTEEYKTATDLAREEFCRVVDDEIQMYH